MSDFSFKNILDKPLKIDSLADKVYRIIEKNIINMTISPGSNLNEDEIARALNISRSPVREALLRLEHVGLVKKTRNGRIVTSITSQEIINNYEIWEMVESFAGVLACENATLKDINKIEEILDKMEELKKEDTIEEYRSFNNQFHQRLVAPCPNKPIVQMHNNALNRVQWCYNYSITWAEDLVSSSSYHHKIFEAYKDKSHQELKEYLQKHIRNACERFQVEFPGKGGEESVE